MDGITWLDWISLAIGIVGLVISTISYRKAVSAKEAAESAKNLIIEKHNQLDDHDRLNQIMSKLVAAKDAGNRRRKGAQEFLGQGYTIEMDLYHLQQAEEMLRIEPVFENDKNLSESIRITADELGKAVRLIRQGNSKRDGWGDAVSAILIVLPTILEAQRKLRLTQLAGPSAPDV